MKNLIMFFVLVMVMVFSNYEVSYSQETGNFYFLIGTEGNERAIMYLHIEGERAYGSYYTESQSIIVGKGEEGAFGFNGSFDGKNLKLGYGGEWDENRSETINKKYITGTLSGDIVFRGKHNSKNVNLSLANTLVNSARIIEDTDDYSSGKKFTFNKRILNNLDSDYLGISEIIYLDENIIIFYGSSTGFRYEGDKYLAYYINTGKRIKSSDIVSNNFLERLDFEGTPSGWAEIFFYITPNGKIVFYYNPGTIQTLLDEDDEDSVVWYTPGGGSIEFTFEELKPFITRGSPLDYLFN